MILAGRPKAKNRIVQPKRYFGHRYKLGDPAYKTINKDVMITLIEPLILIYAFYVLFHGEVSLGGGFQSGALIALTYIIDILVIPDKKNLFMMTGKNSASIAGIGVLPVEFMRAAHVLGHEVVVIGVVPDIDPALKAEADAFYDISVAKTR